MIPEPTIPTRLIVMGAKLPIGSFRQQRSALASGHLGPLAPLDACAARRERQLRLGES